MKVKELISLLQQANQDDDVVIDTEKTEYLSDIDGTKTFHRVFMFDEASGAYTKEVKSVLAIRLSGAASYVC